MSLSKDQLRSLLTQVICAQQDPLDCDRCYEHVAEFAEAELTGKPLCEALQAVRTHLQSCPCCRDEYQALMEGLREVLQNECNDSGSGIVDA